jgi:predicted nucleic acid-binding protein
MLDAVSDTGPILHLSEVQALPCLQLFAQIYLPSLVAAELSYFQLDPINLGITTKIAVVPVEQQQRTHILQSLPPPPLHLADAEVFALGDDPAFPNLVLTDDMALRQHLEQHGVLVVGSVGILVRAYHQNLVSRKDLQNFIDALFQKSTLHASPAFRAFIQNLLTHLP